MLLQIELIKRDSLDMPLNEPLLPKTGRKDTWFHDEFLKVSE